MSEYLNDLLIYLLNLHNSGTGAYNPLETLPTRLGLSIRTADTAMSNPSGPTQPVAPINIMGPSSLVPPPTAQQPDHDQDSDSKSGGRPVMGYEPQPSTSRNFHSFLNFLNNVKSESNQGKLHYFFFISFLLTNEVDT